MAEHRDGFSRRHATGSVSPSASQPWRFIPLLAAPGDVQMAIDHWLLEQHRLGRQPSCLRFYTWSPAALSLGYHQRHYPGHWSSLTWQGKPIDLIRRPTGGRAVLHQGDLTYAVVTGEVTGRRMEVYQHLCQFLIQGWRALGVELSFGAAGRGYIHNPNCFGTATVADLVMPDGYKLIGSAQLYREGCVLQHGSIRLNPDVALFEQVFGGSLQPAQLPVTLKVAAQETQYQVIIQALCEAIQHVFNLELVCQPLSEQEIQAALNLIH